MKNVLLCKSIEVLAYIQFKLKNFLGGIGVLANKIVEDIEKEVDKLGTKNVGIFIDFDNIYYGLKDYAVDLNNNDFCIFTMMNSIYGKDRIRTMRAYADFDQVNDIKLKTLQEKRVQIRNVYGNGKEEMYRKNASDIELSIDAIESYYKYSNIDTFVFVTADSDMIPVMSRMIYKGKKVHLYYIDENISHYQNITEYSHLSKDILKVFDISPERKNPDFWEEKTLKLIKDWYSDNKNQGKMLGGKWLNDELQEKLFMSQHLASSVIQYMEENKKIRKDIVNGRGGYIIEENTKQKQYFS